MLNEQFDYSSFTEGSAQFLPDLARELSLSYAARQDLDEAFGIADGMYRRYTLSFGSVEPLVAVGRAQAEVGLDPTSILEHLIASAEETKAQDLKIYLYRSVAQIYINMGDLSNAEGMLDLTRVDGEYPSPHLHLHIAKARKRLGLDYEYYFQAAKELAGRTYVAERIDGTNEKRFSIEFDDYAKFIHFIQIANNQFEVGLDPQHMLSEAAEIAKTLGSGHQRPALFDLAKGYLSCGYFDEATKLAESIDEDTQQGRYYKRWLREAIAEGQMAYGDLDSAVDTATRTSSNFFVAEVYLKRAIMEFEQVTDGSESVDLALEHIEKYENSIERYPKWHDYHIRLTSLYSLLGQAEALSGKDPRVRFSQALEKLPVPGEDIDYDEIDFDYILAIARAEAVSGVDPTSTLNLVVEWADKITAGEEVNFIDKAVQALAYEEIAKVQMRGGDFGSARETISRLDNDKDIVGMLTELAKAEAREGLSAEDIEEMRLSPEIVEKMRLIDDPRVQEAIEYYFD